MPAGTSLDATAAAATKVEDVLKAHQGRRDLPGTTPATPAACSAPAAAQRLGEPGHVRHPTDPTWTRTRIVDDVRAQVAKLSNAGTITVTGDDASMGGNMSQIEVRVSAADPVALKQANDMVLAQVKTVDGLADVTSNLSEGRPSATHRRRPGQGGGGRRDPATLSQYTTLVLNGIAAGHRADAERARSRPS